MTNEAQNLSREMILLAYKAPSHPGLNRGSTKDYVRNYKRNMRNKAIVTIGKI